MSQQSETSMPITQELQQVFDRVMMECNRSFTKKNLHEDPEKELRLAKLLDSVVTIYGLNITGEFQMEYEGKDSALSFLFAQVSNAISQKSFGHGSCHMQAAYALFELAKANIFYASLVCSKTGDVNTEHFYLLIAEPHTLKQIANNERLIMRVEKNRFNPNSIFFDTWSGQLCKWKDFKNDSRYTAAIRSTDQALFKPLSLLFDKKENVINKILWCLAEYKKRLESLKPASSSSVLTQESSHCSDPYLQEVALLTNPQACIDKLCKTIEIYQLEFKTLLPKESLLANITSTFFGGSKSVGWQEYPKERLKNTKYDNHAVMYLTLKNDLAPRAAEFRSHLASNGFHVEQRDAKGNPSLLVDLTECNPRP